MNARLDTIGSLLALAALAAGAAGCGRSVRVEVAAPRPAEPVRVDVIAATSAEVELFSRYSVSEYFREADPLRRRLQAAEKVESWQFAPGAESTWTLDLSSAAGQAWQDERAGALIVLADLPQYGPVDDRPGSADPRRLILPFGPSRWRGRSQMRIGLSADGLKALTPHAPVPEP